MVFFKPGCPTSTLVLGLCPPTPPHGHAAGMRDAAGTDPAQPSHASPILPAPSRSHSHLFMQQHPNSFLAPNFFPTAYLEPSGSHVRSSPPAVPPGSLCPPLPLLRQQPLGWMQGCVSLLFPGCCCWGSSPGAEGKPRATPCSSCVHPSGDAGGNHSITGSFRNAVFH